MDVEKLREFVEDYDVDGCFCGVFRGCEIHDCRYGLHATIVKRLLDRLEKLERVAEASGPFGEAFRQRSGATGVQALDSFERKLVSALADLRGDG